MMFSLTHIQDNYSYKVTILNNPKRNKKPITRQLHQFSGHFRSLMDMRVRLLEELGDDLPNTVDFDIGFYEKRSSKYWLVIPDYLKRMYEKCKENSDIPLWCDATDIGPPKKLGKRKRDDSTGDKENEEDTVDDIYEDLREKHGDAYSMPQLRLWAKMMNT